jgi:hypothetical protein
VKGEQQLTALGGQRLFVYSMKMRSAFGLPSIMAPLSFLRRHAIDVICTNDKELRFADIAAKFM